MRKKILAVLGLCVMVVSMLSVSASAAEIQPFNNVDKPYLFEFFTPWQDDLRQYKKENTSSVYINSQVFPGNYYIYTNGLVGGKWEDCTQRDAVVPGTGEYLIYNTIMEDYRAHGGTGYTYARLGAFKATLLIGETASGVWSPDSVGSYPHINP